MKFFSRGHACTPRYKKMRGVVFGSIGKWSAKFAVLFTAKPILDYALRSGNRKSASRKSAHAFLDHFPWSGVEEHCSSISIFSMMSWSSSSAATSALLLAPEYFLNSFL